MITSQIPPTRLHSEIRFTTSHNCTNQDGISCGTPYYLHLGEEVYKYSLPINWNATNSEFTQHQFECGVMFESTQLTTLMTTIKGLCININKIWKIYNYINDILNCTQLILQLQMVFQLWIMKLSMLLQSEYLKYFVNGYIITIESSSLFTITHIVNDKSVREFVVNRLYIH